LNTEPLGKLVRDVSEHFDLDLAVPAAESHRVRVARFVDVEVREVVQPGEPRPDVLQPDQTDAGDAAAEGQLGTEWRREDPRQGCRIHLEVDENPPVDHAANGWDLHGSLPRAA
jgi:hypothetical protein